MFDKIIIKGARENNLKNIDLEIPKNKLVVFTGISGSGKSSLAFDTIYAEGQRRYVESLSSYARQFLGIMGKPDVDYIEGLSPAISIDQKGISHNPRSTVGTITEIYDYLRLLFARIGHPHCPRCGREISNQTVEQIVENILEMAIKNQARSGLRIIILAPIIKDRKGEYSSLFNDLRKKGYLKVRLDGQIKDLSDDFVLIKTNKHTVEAVIDRLVLPHKQKELTDFRNRLRESTEQALKLSGGELIVSQIQDKSFEMPSNPQKMLDFLFSEKFACPVCNIAFGEIEPRSFSFNSPHGACPTCGGLGQILEVDPDLVLNPRLSVAEGGILPFARLSNKDTWFSRLLKAVLARYGVSENSPISNFTPQLRQLLLYGSKDEIFTVTGRNRFGRQTSFEENFTGVVPDLERRYRETESEWVRGEIERFMRRQLCPACQGSRLKKESLSVTINDQSIADVSRLSIKKSLSWVENLLSDGKISEREKNIGRLIVKEIKTRLEFLVDVGLDYLTIDRQSSTLAGGEAQRIRLASQIGSGLSGVLYILDEPSIGLHQRDNTRLINTLEKLKEMGNTVIVVEHDREMMEKADWIIDFGPQAGEHGGEIVAQGTIEQIKKNDKSITGKYLSGKKDINLSSSTNYQVPNTNYLTVLGAKAHNLKNIRVDFPLGKFICITGVSGSGKSTLVNDVLYRALAEKYYHSQEKPGSHEGILGQENIDKVILIDQSPIGRTPRSNPATYTGVFTFIRELFAQTEEAKVRGYKQGRFSFNVKGGRCEVCEGDGSIKIEMQFLPDVYITCESCGGKRYNHEALEVTYKDKNIAEILEMTVENALSFFSNIPQIRRKLETLYDVGLGYIRLGQSATTLSGGEAQRIKLSSELSKKSTGRTFYILDEPTTGLHFADIERLLKILRKLVTLGNTVIVIEHNLDVIKNTDWIIDLGPEGGENGGQIVAAGTPSEIAQNPASHTGHYLKNLLK